MQMMLKMLQPICSRRNNSPVKLSYLKCVLTTTGKSVKLVRMNFTFAEPYRCSIYCQGDLLKTVQLAEIFNDSKTFVDLYQLNDPEVTLSNFKKLMEATDNNPNHSQVTEFVSENFAQESDSELETWSPPDWQENPPILNRIKDETYRKWVKELNRIWPQLARKVKPEVAEHPERHSLIYAPNGFIVPGGRFRECYYWDSYWAMRGMLLCGMNDTVRGMLENFFTVIKKYGFIPNGFRRYYLMRSQPPMLAQMVASYMEMTNDIDFLRANIATIELELDYWLQEMFVEVKKGGKTYQVARYTVHSDVGPRPESYREDYNNAQKLGSDRSESFYTDMKAGAQSGWDFTGRWFDETDGVLGNLTTIRTRTIVPVDLNAFLQRDAQLLAVFHSWLNDSKKSEYWGKMANLIQDGLDNVLWNEQEEMWLDYDIEQQRSRNRYYASNFAPLYCGSYNRTKAKDLAESSVRHLEKHGITQFMGGSPVSKDNTGEQWDYPNAWPNMQSVIVFGLQRTGWEPATSLAKVLATRWLHSNYLGFSEYGVLFEKYSAINPGKYGGGGEYNVQTGFGWTLGVIMEFMDQWGESISSEDSASNSDSDAAER
ncbi:trehalase-like isoform X1 [Neodiprion virginianus]|uniref:trehalase-like isoform X1 n=1 Tax=Neodiprion virginianus TaxID=2961670 RepID=UPI001EE7225C|nr:trehalase-like isoform X1 [Neodiprion virginianus]